MTSWSEFLSHVLPPEGTGYYCIGSYKGKETRPLTTLTSTLVDAEKAIQEYLDLKRDVYFGVSKFITADNRKAINAGWNKAIFLDLDCGQKYADEGKGYRTQAEALTELKRVCEELRLPKPNMVNSGNGIHVCWILTESIMKDEWKTVCELFKRQLTQKKLLIDPSKISDPAMVLRIPDTLNFKSDPPKNVEWKYKAEPISLEEFKGLISVGLPDVGLDLAKAPRRPMDETTRALLGNFVSNFSEIMKSKGCQQLLYIYQNQATIEEPLWRAGLSIAQVCEDRDTAIHKISNKHPQYSWKDTENKASSTGGPYKCTTIESINPGGCDGCPNKGKFTSPVQISKNVVRATEKDNVVVMPSAEIGKEITYNIPEFPYPYFRGKNGGVYKQGIVNDDGEEAEKDKLIFKYDFYIVKRMHDEDLGEMVWMRLHLPKDGVREFACPATSIMVTDQFKEIVGKRGVIGNAQQMKEVMDYITRFAQDLQDRYEAEKMRVQFGWCEDNTKFIIGDREIGTDGIRYSPPSHSTAAFVPWFKPKGNLDNWKRVVNSYGREGQEARAFLFFAGLGSPLMPFTNLKGLIYSITENESGTGKTTIQRVINSIWGHPSDLMLIKKDTTKSQYHQMGTYNNLPICIDEITSMTDEQASDIAYGVSQGRSNNRMKSNSNEMRINNTRWALACFVSGNDSMHDKIAALKATPEAEQLRIAEVEIAKDDTMTKEESDELFEDVLMTNYGLAGDILMEYVVANLEEVKALLKKTQVEFDKAAGLSQKQRFYSASAACAFTMGIIAGKLKLHDIPTDKVWDWAVNYFTSLKDSVKPAVRNPLSALGMFLNSHMRNLLVVDDIADKRTGLTSAPLVKPFGDLLVRYEPDTKLLFIDSQALRKWCREQQIAFKSTVEGLKIVANAQFDSKAMSKGTELSTPSVPVLRLDGSKLDQLIDIDAMKRTIEDQAAQ